MKKENGTNVPTGRDNTYDKTEVHRKSIEELFESSFSADQKKALLGMDIGGGGGGSDMAADLKNVGTPSVDASLDDSTGETQAEEGKITTDFIPVASDYIFLKNGQRYWFYDENKQPMIVENITTVTGDDMDWESGTLTNAGAAGASNIQKRTPSAKAYDIPAPSITITSIGKDMDGITFATGVCQYAGTTFIKRNIFNGAAGDGPGTPIERELTFEPNCTKIRFTCGYSSSSGKTSIADSDVLMVSYRYSTDSAHTGDATGESRIEVPSGAAYIRITMDSLEWEDAVVYSSKVLDFFAENGSGSDTPTPTESEKVLYTIGDSITRGTVAPPGSSQGQGQTPYHYPYWIAKINNFELHNLGVSGTGWVCGSQNGPYIADNNNFANADYIVIAYGVNDYKMTSAPAIGSLATSLSNDGTIVGNMMYTLEKIISKAPQAKLFILGPLNGNRVWDNVDPVEADNWYMGTPIGGRTLGEVSVAMKTVAEHYGIEFIDQAQVGPVNRKNLRTLLGDGLHPSVLGHEMIGRSLAPFIH